MFRVACLSAMVAVFCPTAVLAQLEVLVADSSGRGVSGARVELWSATALVVARTTDSAGVVRYSAAEKVGAIAGLVRRIGFAPGHFSLDASSASVSVRLEEIAFSIPTFTVTAVAAACPQGDDAAARAVWERTAARYREPWAGARITDMEQRTSTVAEADVGIVDAEQLWPGWRTYTADGMEGAVRRVARSGYVYPLNPMHGSDLLGAWQYPPLEAELALHFASATFGEGHTFRIVTTMGSVTTLRFCARDRRRSGLDGTLRIAEVDGFLDARWRFWNPARDSEKAGGEATFAPVDRLGEGSLLLSTSGLFWRQTPSGRYAQRWQRYQGWRVGETPSTPCSPADNYILCSVSSTGQQTGRAVDCNSRPYRCEDD